MIPLIPGEDWEGHFLGVHLTTDGMIGDMSKEYSAWLILAIGGKPEKVSIYTIVVDLSMKGWLH